MPSKLIKEMMDEEEKFRIPTAMIDVVFLLLIFLVVGSRFKTLEQRLEANLPKDTGITAIQKEDEIPEDVLIRIRKDRTTGEPRWIAKDTQVTSLDDLVALLKELRANVPKISINIRGDKNVPFWSVLGVLDACARLNPPITNVKFTAPPKES